MNKNILYKRFITSQNLGKQILGALIQWRRRPFWLFLLIRSGLNGSRCGLLILFVFQIIKYRARIASSAFQASSQ